MTKSLLVVDGHVHVYDCYDLDRFFAAAIDNTTRLAGSPGPCAPEMQRLLLLTEGRENDFFSRFKDGSVGLQNPDYKFESTYESHSLVLTYKGEPACYILKGRQIVSKENLEVLAPATEQVIEDGLPILEVLARLRANDDIAVLAWGVGKWLFRRGKIVREILENFDYPYLYVGDNSARPSLWPKPRLYKKAGKAGIPVIYGSDPLPFPFETAKPGSYGFILEGEWDEDYPCRSFLHCLTGQKNGERFERYGYRDTFSAFFRRQVKMFLKKYL